MVRRMSKDMSKKLAEAIRSYEAASDMCGLRQAKAVLSFALLRCYDGEAHKVLADETASASWSLRLMNVFRAAEEFESDNERLKAASCEMLASTSRLVDVIDGVLEEAAEKEEVDEIDDHHC